VNTDCEPVELDLPAEPTSVRRARATASRLADACGADSATVALCVSEATTNAILHAYRGEAPGDRTVHLSAWPDADHLVVEISDHGGGMRPRADSPGLGLGLPLIATLAQTVEVHGGDPGTTVRMTFALA
jgi:anti-sigma regulatory factor (Ser/Thr protein kinase)